jgi:hypothetical protein
MWWSSSGEWRSSSGELEPYTERMVETDKKTVLMEIDVLTAGDQTDEGRRKSLMYMCRQRIYMATNPCCT